MLVYVCMYCMCCRSHRTVRGDFDCPDIAADGHGAGGVGVPVAGGRLGRLLLRVQSRSGSGSVRVSVCTIVHLLYILHTYIHTIYQTIQP